MNELELRLHAIDIFGARSIAPAQLLEALAFEEGQPWSHDMVEPAWERLAKTFDLEDLRLTPVGYGDERIFLSVDLVEAEQRPFAWHQPRGAADVPPALHEVLARYNETREAFWKLGRATAERVSEEGYFASADEALLRIERQAAELIDRHFEQALAATRDSEDEALRAGLVYLLGWAAQKQRAAEALVYALADESNWVRNNAARALLPLALRATRRHDLRLPLEPLVELLRVASALDRARTLALLGLLAESPETRRYLRERALPALHALARLRQPNNRAPAQALLAMLALDDPPVIDADEAEHAVLSSLAQQIAGARSPAELLLLLDPNPHAPAHRQVADSVFPAPDEQVRITASIHSIHKRAAPLAELLVALDIVTGDSRRQSAARFSVARSARSWRLWSVGAVRG
jgi:hypothetical protein